MSQIATIRWDIRESIEHDGRHITLSVAYGTWSNARAMRTLAVTTDRQLRRYWRQVSRANPDGTAPAGSVYDTKIFSLAHAFGD